MMIRRAFSLVELLTVVAIIVILYAILMPVFVSMKGYAHQYVAGQSMMKLSMATAMYAGDHDETFPIAYYTLPDGSRQDWFGWMSAAGELDTGYHLLKSYAKTIQVDRSLNALPWLGDETGFGYNWGYLGSDYYLDNPLSNGYTCFNPATYGQIGLPAEIVEFGTSSFYYAPWLPFGDGQTYRYGYVDPPKAWFGNPTVDFRHFGKRVVDQRRRRVTNEGNALIVFVDGHLQVFKQGKLKNHHFQRGEPVYGDLLN